MAILPSVRRTFSFNNSAKKDMRLSDLIENQRILEARFPQTNEILNGKFVTCKACKGNCCDTCGYEGVFWEEGIGLLSRGGGS